MRIIVDIAKTVLKIVAIFFVMEICAKVFLTRTFVGRVIGRTLMDIAKTAAWVMGIVLRTLKALMKEANKLGKQLSTVAYEYLQTSKREDNLEELEDDEKVVSIKKYLENQKAH